MTTPYTGDPTKGWKSSINIFDDNDKPKAAAFAAQLVPIMDDLAQLHARGIQDVRLTTSYAYTGIGEIQGPSGSAAWSDFPSSDGALQPFQIVPNCLANDILLCVCHGTFGVEGQSYADIRLNSVQAYLDAGETSYPVPGAQSKVTANTASADPKVIPITMFGRVVLSLAGDVRIQLQGRNTAAGGSYKVGVDSGIFGSFVGSQFTIGVLRIRPY